MKPRPGIVRALVLVVWGAFFAWLVLSGEVYRYIGPRTEWVVIFGALSLTIVSVVYLVNLRGSGSSTNGWHLGSLVLLIPVLVVVALPRPSLGSLAASRKLSGAPAVALQPQPLGPGEEVSFPEIEYASESSEYAATVGIVDGYEVELTGFVTHPDSGAGDFSLTRFSIFCCAADVVPHSVDVDSQQDYPDDQWLTISGALQQRDGKWVVVARSVQKISEPKDPYLR